MSYDTEKHYLGIYSVEIAYTGITLECIHKIKFLSRLCRELLIGVIYDGTKDIGLGGGGGGGGAS